MRSFGQKLKNGIWDGDLAKVDASRTQSIVKMASLLQSGTDSQKTVILFELQRLFEHCYDDTVSVLVPILCKELVTWPPELQLSAAEALADIMNKLVPKEVAKMVCNAAFDIVSWHKTEDIFEAWGEILVVIMPTVSWDHDNDICSVIAILDDFSMSNEIVCRKLVARLVGTLASCLKTGEVETYVLNRALHLADDDNVDVRGMAAESLALIGSIVSIEIVENCIWPVLLGLLKDSDARVHAATLRTISQILTMHRGDQDSTSLFKTLLPPVFSEECDFAEKAAKADQRKVDDDTYLLLEIFSEVFGQLLLSAHAHLKNEIEQTKAFFSFLAMATCNGPVVRRYCAFNLPGVSKCFAEIFPRELSSIVEFLSRDADSETRWNLAAGIHETSRILMGKGTVDNLFKTVVALLQDESSLVRMNALEHFYELVLSLTGVSGVNSAKKLVPVFQNLNLLAKGNWRCQELLAMQLEKTTELVPPNCLFADVLPLLCGMADDSTYRVRKAAMSAIAKTMWCFPYLQEREAAMTTFAEEWGAGDVFWMRTAFIDCAYAASKVFSAGLFNTLFTDTLFKLASDSVPNVRLRIATIIYAIAPLCHQNPRFKGVINILAEDADKDVREKMAETDAQIAQALENMDAFEEENKRREEAERAIQSRGEKLKAESRRKGAKGRVRGVLFTPKVPGKGVIQLSPVMSNQYPEGTHSPTSIMITTELEDKAKLTEKGAKSSTSGESSFKKGGSDEYDERTQQQIKHQRSVKTILSRSVDESSITAALGRRRTRKSQSQPIGGCRGRHVGDPNENRLTSPSPRRSLRDLLGMGTDGADRQIVPLRRGPENLWVAHHEGAMNEYTRAGTEDGTGSDTIAMREEEKVSASLSHPREFKVTTDVNADTSENAASTESRSPTNSKGSSRYDTLSPHRRRSLKTVFGSIVQMFGVRAKS